MGGRSCTNILNIDTFEYNDFGELTSAKVNGVNSTYTYRADGLRWYKTVNGAVTRHLWDGDDVIMDMTDGYGIINEYTRGLGLIRYTDGTNTRYYTRNRHGDTNHMIDAATATLANTYKYDAYGNQRNDSFHFTGDTNPYRYSGEYYDYETGFIYLRARYYDSTTGTFITEDPARDGINWYAYCAGNPVMYVDPSGLEIVITGDEFERSILLSMIQELTDAKLSIEEYTKDDGTICYYVSEGEIKEGGKYATGTKLIHDLIVEDKTVNVSFGEDSDFKDGNDGICTYDDPIGATTLTTGSDSIIKIRRGYKYSFGTGLSTLQADDGTIMENGKTRLYMVLGHELVHAWRAAKGLKFGYTDSNGKMRQGSYEYVDAKGHKRGGIAEEEELVATGIKYTAYNEKTGAPIYTVDHSSSGYITENALRAEHGLPKRVAYQ